MFQIFKISMGLWLLGVFLPGVPSVMSTEIATAAPTQGPNQAQGGTSMVSENVNQQLKQAIVDAGKKMTSLEAWQKKIFDEEAVSQFQRFIKDYRSSAAGTHVEVDLDTLQNYLRFYAPNQLKNFAENSKPGTLPEYRVLVFLKGDSACVKCVESEKNIRTLVKARLERRGLTPQWLSAAELGDAQTFKAMESKLSSRMSELKSETKYEKKLAGYYLLSWSQLLPDDIDSAHVDEKHYRIEHVLSFKEFSRQTGRLDLQEHDTFESSLVRLMTDTFTALGAKLIQGTLTPSTAVHTEILIKITGFKNFQHYSNVKKQLLTQIPGLQFLEERRMTRGLATLAVGTSLAREDLEKQIRVLPFELVDGERIHVEVIP